jgi:hypothetical protein
MADESPAANPPDDTPPAKRGRLLATRGRKIAAIVGAAFLATIGGILATSLLDLGKSTGKKVLGGSQAPLTVKILPRDSLEDTMVVLPYYVVPRGELPGPDAVGKSDLRSMGENTAESKNWAAEHHAVDGSPQVVNLELRARSDEPVAVTGIKVHVLKKRPRVDGWFVAPVTGCGVEPVRLALVDLDAAIPRVEFYESDASPEASRLALSVTRTDAELVQLIARTRKALVDWQAEVLYSGPDGDGSVIVNDDGAPFRVSTEIGSTAYKYEGQGKARREPFWDRGIRVC